MATRCKLRDAVTEICQHLVDSFTRNRDPTDEQPYFPSIRKFNRILLVVNCGDEILEAMGQSVTFLQALQDSGGFDKLQYNSSKSAFY